MRVTKRRKRSPKSATFICLRRIGVILNIVYYGTWLLSLGVQIVGIYFKESRRISILGVIVTVIVFVVTEYKSSFDLNELGLRVADRNLTTYRKKVLLKDLSEVSNKKIGFLFGGNMYLEERALSEQLESFFKEMGWETKRSPLKISNEQGLRIIRKNHALTEDEQKIEKALIKIGLAEKGRSVIDLKKTGGDDQRIQEGNFIWIFIGVKPSFDPG